MLITAFTFLTCRLSGRSFVTKLGKNSLVSIDLITAKHPLRLEAESFKFDWNVVNPLKATLGL